MGFISGLPSETVYLEFGGILGRKSCEYECLSYRCILTDHQQHYRKDDRGIMNMMFETIEKGVTLSHSNEAPKAWQALYTVAVPTRKDAYHRATAITILCFGASLIERRRSDITIA